jgi:exodeoxyribonuclease III
VIKDNVKQKQMKLSSLWAKTDTTTLKTSTEINMPLQINNKLNIVNVFYDFNDPGFCNEGRVITIEFEQMFLVGCYTPNSGEGLKRLDYRISTWDTYMKRYLNGLKVQKPVIYTGDLNVAHLDLDIYNFDAKHIMKQAGLTPEERQSFGDLLAQGYKDALRFLYPSNVVKCDIILYSCHCCFV